MPFERRTVPLAAIDLTDQSFRITTEESIDELTDSLKTIGLLHSPLLTEKKGRFTVVSGFRRIRSALRLGWDALDARVAGAGMQGFECARYAAAENALQRRLNLIELSRALNLLAEFLPDPEKLAAWAPSLGLPGNPTVIGKIQRIGSLAPGVQKLILDDILSLSMALELQRLPAAECLAFAGIFGDLRLSLGKQREFLTLVNEIALREEKSALAILAEADLQQVLSDENLSRVQKASAARSYLKQRRFPVLSKAHKEFEEFRSSLSLGPGVALIPPSDFEGTGYTIRLEFDSMAELRSRQETLSALIENERLKKMLG